MAYCVIGDRDNRWQPRKGLEGPFYFATGRVLYYDSKQGQYWDPTTDFFVPNEEVAEFHSVLMRMLSK
jgi:hypothetical protein